MNPADEAIRDMRSRVGGRAISFNDIADHLHEFRRLHPGSDRVVGEIALYPTESEFREHRHDGRHHQEEMLDPGSDQSFPASDPPSSSVPQI